MTDHPDTATRLATILAEQLRKTGHAHGRYHDHRERDLLRAAGRMAGRTLHRPVRTRDQPADERAGTVIVVITDWATANPLERQLADVRADRANHLIDRALSQP